jgi:glycosyltransferase involved in cell wall biosynthesis
MEKKPELLIFSQYLLGGGTSFHRNMMAHFPDDFFDIRCIYLNPTNWDGAKALEIQIRPNDILFPYGGESTVTIAKNLSKFISSEEGVVIANLETELICLDIFRKPKKTVFFVCHDDGFIPLAVKYESIIDTFIAHNIAVYHELQRLLKDRKSDIFFIQHGVQIPSVNKVVNTEKKLKIVFLARHHAFKGIYDLPVINELLVQMGVDVEWMILGDGPERNNLIKSVERFSNFQFQIPQTTSELLEVLKGQDVFILPSRSDGLPVALLESMSVGCVPLLANFSEGIKRVVTEQIGFVVPVGDNVQFAEKIKLLSEDRVLLKMLSANCIDKVKREFDISKQALEYFNLYKKYKQFSKRHKVGLKDMQRVAGYYSTYNKIVHILNRARKKIGVKKER